MDSQEFYHSHKWKKVRARALRRDGYICQECRRYGRIVKATQVHHIKPLEEYPELALVLDNLTSLCFGCHNKKHPEKGRNSLLHNRVDKLY